MATLVPVPKLGQSEETVSIVRWHKAEGDPVTKGDVLFEVETDKAVLEVESQFQGTLLKMVLPEGKEVPVMSIACVIGEPGEEIPPIPEPAPAKAEASPAPLQREAPVAPVAPASSPLPQPTPGPAPAAAGPAPAPAPAGPAPPAPRRKAISPRARKLAAQFLIDTGDVPGTGPSGRVVERDVVSYLDDTGYHGLRITPAAARLAKNLELTIFGLRATGATGRITLADVRRAEAERPTAMSKMRQTISRRLQQSKQQIPHFYVAVSVDMTELLALRAGLKAQGFDLSINDFIVKAVGLALVECPAVNSATEDGLSVSWCSDVNIGLAVSIEGGLVVPVLRNADRMPLDELHEAAREMAEKARGGRLTPEDMSGGTFTVSNMGMLDVEEFVAIINPGESAILAVSSVTPTAVVDADRQVVVRDMMRIVLSADHRVIDGAMGAAFVNVIKRTLEDVASWRKEVDQSPVPE